MGLQPIWRPSFSFSLTLSFLSSESVDWLLCSTLDHVGSVTAVVILTMLAGHRGGRGRERW